MNKSSVPLEMSLKRPQNWIHVFTPVRQSVSVRIRGNNEMAIAFPLLLALSLAILPRPAFSQAEESWFSYDVTISDDSVATLTAS